MPDEGRTCDPFAMNHAGSKANRQAISPMCLIHEVFLYLLIGCHTFLLSPALV